MDDCPHNDGEMTAAEAWHAGEEAKRFAILRWAVGRWRAEVENRPLVNVNRRTLDDTWRQVMRQLGGDPVALVGPAHDDLLEANRG